MRGLHEVVPETSQPLDPGADLLPADELHVDVGDPPRAVLREQRREAVLVAHHHRVGELAAQRLDLEAISDGLKVAHRFLLPVLQRCWCLGLSAQARVGGSHGLSPSVGDDRFAGFPRSPGAVWGLVPARTGTSRCRRRRHAKVRARWNIPRQARHESAAAADRATPLMSDSLNGVSGRRRSVIVCGSAVFQLCQMPAAMASRRWATRAKTPRGCGRRGRSRSSWPLRVWLTDSIHWRTPPRLPWRCVSSLRSGRSSSSRSRWSTGLELPRRRSPCRPSRISPGRSAQVAVVVRAARRRPRVRRSSGWPGTRGPASRRGRRPGTASAPSSSGNARRSSRSRRARPARSA